MPDQPLLGVASHHALDQFVGGLVLLVAANDFDAALFLVCRKQGETAQNVQHHVGPQHALGRQLKRFQRVVLGAIRLFAFVQVPWAPVLYWQANRAVVVLLALGGHREHVAHEQLGHKFLVVRVHLHGTIYPADALLDRRFGLNQHQWQAVDQQHQIGTALSGSSPVGVLLGNDVLVLRQVI